MKPQSKGKHQSIPSIGRNMKSIKRYLHNGHHLQRESKHRDKNDPIKRDLTWSDQKERKDSTRTSLPQAR
jgi:hypothetical protein